MRLASYAVLTVSLVAMPILSAVRADDPPAKPAAPDAALAIKDWGTEIDAATAAKDEARLVAGIKRAPMIYKAAPEGAVRAPVMHALGRLVKQTKYPLARSEALTSLVATGDGKEAYKALQPVYPRNEVEDAGRFNVEIVRAIGALAPDAAIPALVDTYRKAKQFELTAEAALALGHYGTSKQRERILDDIYHFGKSWVPTLGTGLDASLESGEATIARWNTIGPSIGRALDNLTGDDFGTAEEWFKRIAETKDRRTLFRK